MTTPKDNRTTLSTFYILAVLLFTLREPTRPHVLGGCLLSPVLCSVFTTMYVLNSKYED